MSDMDRTRRPLVVVAAAVASVAVAACGSKGATSTGGAAQAGVSTTVPKIVPPGTTLRVGDQLDALKLVLGTSGQDKAFPYTVKYANFVGGPSMLQAFNAGAIDVGYVASTPLIFAQAARQDIVAVAAWAPEHGSLELIATPGSNIRSWADLKGRRVAYQQGTVLQSVLLSGLRSAGLSPRDIKSVNIPVTQIAAALEGGTVDAAILTPPLDTAYLSKHPDALVVDRPDDLPLRLSTLVVPKSTLANPAKIAAVRDYVQRLVRAYGWIAANPDVWIQKFWVGQYGLPPTAGKAQLQRVGTTAFVELPGDVVGPQQQLADLFVAAGEIPKSVDASKEFDGRLDDAVHEARAAASR